MLRIPTAGAICSCITPDNTSLIKKITTFAVEVTAQKVWARGSPEFIAAHLLLVQREIARLQREVEDAAARYRLAKVDKERVARNNGQAEVARRVKQLQRLKSDLMAHLGSLEAWAYEAARLRGGGSDARGWPPFDVSEILDGEFHILIPRCASTRTLKAC